MGLGLSHPVSSKILERKGNKSFRVGSASMHGWRETMEDAHTIELSLPKHNNTAFFGIFDGHSGSLCSKYVAANLYKNFNELDNFDNHDKLSEVVMNTDEQFLTSPEYKFKDDGSAAIFCIISCDNNQYTVKSGNVGDSRTVLANKEENGWKTVELTDDHKPTNPMERDRIVNAGGVVQMNRVDGQLALSRAFGDRMLKTPLDAKPELRKVTSKPDWIEATAKTGDFVVMACDGIYECDIFDREGVVKYVADKLNSTNDLAVICADLLEECLARGSKDNMSVMIIQFEDGESYNQEGFEYRPGPYYNMEGDQKFMEAYERDASAAGYNLTQALELRKKHEAEKAQQQQVQETNQS
eukprot:TRINITY_DN11187_c0_g1_i1.p1 TRINITY_DN11187_c0_g1~~TRINITY_DN11187_c0_g1_i1.p1  ORF type:complete len:355 (+),score=81.17 TRINITY_DN11187_c0_g1_i1:84-1148(+)